MYSLPWIIDNMISETKQITKSRQPSEVELKAQKSLQRLSVPDWYTNKSVASPKIIVDRRPFESRPAPWKDPIRNRKPLSNPWKNAVANTVVKPVVGNRKMPQSEIEKLSEVTKVSNVIRSSQSYSSKTFPKMSPSRKIQNINIVFPTTTTSHESIDKSTNDDVTSGTLFLDKSISSIGSLEKFTPQTMSTLEDIPRTVSLSPPIKTSTVRPLAFQERGKMPRMNCSPPAVPKTPTKRSNQESFNFQDLKAPTPRIFADTEKILTSPPSELSNISSSMSQNNGRISRMNCPPPPAPVTPIKKSDKNQSSYLEQSPISESVFLTPNKSTELEKMIKTQQKRSPGKTLVEEIIEELNAKCMPKVKSNYTSPTSKNFVRKLVQALEMGHIPKRDDEDAIFESCGETDCKSETSTASISMKDTDSDSGSDSEPKSSASNISGDSTFRSFSKALENREKIPRESRVCFVDDKDDSVFWIPLPNCKIPRTSSLKSIPSNFSSRGGTSSPISSNPDSYVSREEPPLSWQGKNLQNFNASGWGKTFDRKQLRSRQLFRIAETTVIDSGYSDRSGTSSSRSSSIDESWYGDSETTQTASEIGEDDETIYSNQSRPRKLPAHRLRTFLV